MEEEFMKYVNEKKLLDEEIYEKFAEYYVKKLNLKDVVKDIAFIDDTYTHYNQFQKRVVLSLNQLYDFALSRVLLNAKGNEKENIYFVNAELLFYFLHELVHGKQMNIIEGREKGNKLIIKALEDSYDRIKFQKLYNRFHDYYLIEHNANTEGQFILSEFLSGVENGYGYDLGPLYYYLRLAYEKYKNNLLSPLEKENMLFYIRLKLDEILKDEEYLKMNEYDKIKFGLPINENTYNKIYDLPEKKVKDYKIYFK